MSTRHYATLASIDQKALHGLKTVNLAKNVFAQESVSSSKSVTRSRKIEKFEPNSKIL